MQALDELAPFFRGDARRVVLGHVDHVHGHRLRGAGLNLALGPLAPGPVGVPYFAKAS
jgi:hypothetical protein